MKLTVKEHKTEILCLNLIALQQPIAKDLRMIAAMFENFD